MPLTAEVGIRLRSDLEFYRQRCRAHQVWVIKDPVSLRYFQFREDEYFILRCLDGRTSLEEIQRRFEQRFAPRRMTTAKIHTFAVNLHRNGLVISSLPGQGRELLDHRIRHRRSRWVSRVSNPLAIQFRGFNPQPLLDWLYPPMRWIFTPTCCLVGVLMMLAAALLVTVQFEQFRSNLPELNSFLSPRNLFALAAVLAVTKVLHEFGHALTCRHFGAECHELGFMLLVFTPCLYCNVTDAWTLPSRRQRVCITAAGMCVEIFLASVCTFLWWFSQPGWLHTVCLNVMTVCTVGTVLLNGNPLLRYDGYYILSDLLETPNLWQESRACIRRLVSKYFWGFAETGTVTLAGRPGLLYAYGVSSMLYRTVVLCTILYLVYQFLKPRGLMVLVQVITVATIAGILTVPISSTWETLRNPFLRMKVKPLRVAFACTGLALVGAAGLFFPLPCRVRVAAIVQPLDARRIYVPVAGILRSSRTIGDVVEKGQMIAQLENSSLQLDLQRMQGQLFQQQMRVRNLEALRSRDSELTAQLPTSKQILADLKERLTQLRRDYAKLRVVSPVDGTILSPTRVPAPLDDTATLRSWIGTPLEERNLGCALARRTLLCLVGDPKRFDAALFVPQSDVDYVRVGQRVRLLLDHSRGAVITGCITEISRNQLEVVPAELATDQTLASQVDEGGIVRPKDTLYQATVALDAHDVPLVIGARGRAKILVEKQPVGLQIYRFLTRTFRPVI